MDLDLLRASAQAAHDHADQLDREINARWPGAWQTLDVMRRRKPMPWPDWCLLPMAAPASLVTSSCASPPGASIAAMSALYAWRYARSVYLVHPALLDRLLRQVPDPVDGVGDLADLPQWCVYVAEGETRLWLHLEHDTNTGRPELRILLDSGASAGLEGLLPIPVYLDRPTITEAIADMRATTLASMGGRTGADVRGGDLDATVAALAERVEAYVALARYLCRPEADIRSLSGSSSRPRRYRSPVRDREVWLVGYGS